MREAHEKGGRGVRSSDSQIRRYHTLREQEKMSPVEAAKAVGRSRSWGYEREKRGPNEIEATDWWEKECRTQREAVDLLIAMESGDWQHMERLWGRHQSDMWEFASVIAEHGVRIAKENAAATGCTPAAVLSDFLETVKKQLAEDGP